MNNNRQQQPPIDPQDTNEKEKAAPQGSAKEKKRFIEMLNQAFKKYDTDPHCYNTDHLRLIIQNDIIEVLLSETSR